MRRTASAIAIVLITGAGQWQAAAQGGGEPAYTLRETIDLGFARPLIHPDMGGDRVFLASADGLRILDLRTGAVGDPVIRLRFTGAFELAPDLGRIFAEVDSDRIAVLDASSFEEVGSFETRGTSTLVYDPVTREVFVASFRSSVVDVFAGPTATHVTSIELPRQGGRVQWLSPGRLLVQLQDDLYVLDTAARQLRPLPVDVRADRIVAFPGRGGATLFITTDRQLVAVDAATGVQLAAVNTGERVLAAYDPLADVVLVTFRPSGSPLRRLMVLRHGPDGFTRIAEQELPAGGQGLPRPTAGGFVTLGVLGNVQPGLDRRYVKLLIWDRKLESN